MSSQANPKLIGAFVIGALALFVTGILVFSGGTWFRTPTRLVSYFPGSVAGLRIGAPVEFQGVRVGEVVDVRLEVHNDDGRFEIPVYYDIYEDQVTIYRTGDKPGSVAEQRANYTMLIERQGLRAKLEPVSLVTGQYMVTLGLEPDTEAKLHGAPDHLIEIPTVEAVRDRLGDVFRDLDLKALAASAMRALDAVEKLAGGERLDTLLADADTAVNEIRDVARTLNKRLDGLMVNADGTLTKVGTLAANADGNITRLSDSFIETSESVGKLSRDVDAEVGPLSTSAKDALASARKALDAINDMIGEDSNTRYNLEVMLEEAASAARSLRILADYLEQNPDALIKGKYR